VSSESERTEQSQSKIKPLFEFQKRMGSGIGWKLFIFHVAMIGWNIPKEIPRMLPQYFTIGIAKQTAQSSR
jgi:uncharacterized membrane protein